MVKAYSRTRRAGKPLLRKSAHFYLNHPTVRKILKRTDQPEEWKPLIRYILPHVPPARWKHVLMTVFPRIIREWDSHPDDIVRKFYPDLLGNTQFVERVRAIRDYLRETEYSSAIERLMMENFNTFVPKHRVLDTMSSHFQNLNTVPSARLDISRRKQKTTQFLGGKHRGIVVRLVLPHAFQAWKRARQAGIPVEPILTKNGKDRAYNSKLKITETHPDGGPGTYTVDAIRVYTRYVGKTIEDYKLEHSPFYHEMQRQKNELLKQMNDAHIVYSKELKHIKDENFAVRFEKGKPKVYVIDFKFASLVHEKSTKKK